MTMTTDTQHWQSCLDKYAKLKEVWKKEPPSMDIYIRERELYIQLMSYICLPQKGTFLDIGAGEGKMRQFLPETLTYIGIDPLADKFPGKGVKKGIGENLNEFKNNSIDIALIHSSLDHCISPPTVFSEVYRVLKPGGKFCVSALVGCNQSDHTYSFPSVQSLYDLFEIAGFTVLKYVSSRKPNVVDIIGVKGSIRSTGAVLLGGILIGDTLRLSQYINECAGTDKILTGIGDKYNEGVLDLFCNYSNVALSDYMVLPGGEKRPKGSWEDAVDFQNRGEVVGRALTYDTTFTPTEQTLACPLPPFTFNGAVLPGITLPDEFIAVQPASCHAWKSMTNVAYARYPLPVVNIGAKGDVLAVKDAIDMRGKTIAESTYIMSKAKLVVGIDSSMSQLAAQIGVPAIKCHFGGWEYDNRNVRDCGGADLLKPLMSNVENTVRQALEMINKGQKDISALSKR